MKKSFRSPKPSSPRHVSRPSVISKSRPASASPASSHPKEKFGFSGQPSNQGYNPGNQSMMPRQRWYRRRSSLIGGIVGIVLCCLVVACLAVVVYLVSQGVITLPSG